MSKKQIEEPQSPVVAETEPQNDAQAKGGVVEIEALRKLYEGKTCIYAGPNLHGGKLVSSSIFRGGLPPHVLTLIVQHPEIKTLLVPVGEFAKTKQGIETKGSELHRVYEQLKVLRIKFPYDEEAKA